MYLSRHERFKLEIVYGLSLSPSIVEFFLCVSVCKVFSRQDSYTINASTVYIQNCLENYVICLESFEE